MKHLISAVFVMCVMAMAGGVVFAASNDTITVNYEVQAINELNIDDASVTLTVDSATAGSDPTQATDSTTYDVTTNAGDNAKKITAAINTAMPSGLTLKINMTAPTGASSAGAVTLSATAVDAVTLIDSVSEANIAAAFTLDATLAAGVVASASKTCTLTLADS